MIVEYFGHDFFRLAFADGTRLVTDPYDVLYNYPKRQVEADICTISHHHFDHDGVAALTGTPQLIDTAGLHIPREGLYIHGISSFHDEAQGQKRGLNLIFLIEAEGLRIVHLGDLGHLLTDAQLEALGEVDILLLPVGGCYTVDAPAAVHVMEQLHPQVTIPMHYQTAASGAMTVAPVADFLSLLNIAPQPLSLARITAQDISQRPPVLLMTTPEGL